MAKVKIKQIRSAIDRSLKQKRTLKALGLKKMNGTVEHEMNDTIRGMIFKVSHLVEVTEIDSDGDHEVNQKKSSDTKPSVVSGKEQVEGQSGKVSATSDSEHAKASVEEEIQVDLQEEE